MRGGKIPKRNGDESGKLIPIAGSLVAMRRLRRVCGSDTTVGFGHLSCSCARQAKRQALHIGKTDWGKLGTHLCGWLHAIGCVCTGYLCSFSFFTDRHRLLVGVCETICSQRFAKGEIKTISTRVRTYAPGMSGVGAHRRQSVQILLPCMYWAFVIATPG